MNTQNGLLLWVLGGAGVLFLYAAYKNQNPQTILLNHLQGTATGKTANPGAGVEAQAKTAPAPAGVSGGAFPGLYADKYGNPIGVIPAGYRGNPNLYIATGAVNA